MRKSFLSAALALLLLSPGLQAARQIQDDQDRPLVPAALDLAYHLAATKPDSPVLSDLTDWLSVADPENLDIKALKEALVFGGAVKDRGGAAKALAAKFSNAAEAVKGAEFPAARRSLYLALAVALDKDDKNSLALLQQIKDSGLEVRVAQLVRQLPAAVYHDPEVEARKLAAAQAAAAKNVVDTSKALTTPEEERKKIRKLLMRTKFPNFDYSEATALDAINRLNQFFYWQGFSFDVQGSRLGIIDRKKAENGCVFFVSPLFKPERDTYHLKDVTVFEILQSFTDNLNMEFNIVGNKVILTDGKPSDPTFTPPGGVDLEKLASRLRGGAKEDITRWRGQEISFTGTVSGISDQDNGNRTILLNGGKLKLLIRLVDVDNEGWKEFANLISTEKAKKPIKNNNNNGNKNNNNGNGNNNNNNTPNGGNGLDPVQQVIGLHLTGFATVDKIDLDKITLTKGSKLVLEGRKLKIIKTAFDREAQEDLDEL